MEGDLDQLGPWEVEVMLAAQAGGHHLVMSGMDIPVLQEEAVMIVEVAQGTLPMLADPITVPHRAPREVDTPITVPRLLKIVVAPQAGRDMDRAAMTNLDHVIERENPDFLN